ncbi:glutathione S-transferase family protein [Inhella crocodyli]|uniref:Glutathione S-transferase n=1 Tax=Inhella crocodyli TaxID=2499851 RepID=A0A3S2WRA7_9BURK|nr:glutathione S-transferase N-terminal domain-containing protein [Inhella crocodyli]RVT86025.1 glutathione S-transferase [Inhella crocodyli]
MIRLHHSNSSAAMAPHIVLEELGLPFELVPVDTATGAHRQAPYLRLNPNGVIPTLEDGELVLYETVAILMHLADTHPEGGLLPAMGTPERAQAMKWLIWSTNTLQATLIAYFYPERWAPDHPAEVKATVQARIRPMLQQLDEVLADGRPWFMGAAFSLVDVMVFMLSRWTRHFDDHPARGFPHLGPYLQRVLARPAVQRVFAREGLQPFV